MAHAAKHELQQKLHSYATNDQLSELRRRASRGGATAFRPLNAEGDNAAQARAQGFKPSSLGVIQGQFNLLLEAEPKRCPTLLMHLKANVGEQDSLFVDETKPSAGDDQPAIFQ